MMLTLGQKAVMMEHKIYEQEEITKKKKCLTNLAHACDRYNITDKVGAAVMSAALKDVGFFFYLTFVEHTRVRITQ